jgi:pimeloyl-ACP methyl ester carboxylesterase
MNQANHTNMKMDKYYHSVPEDSLKKLLDFRQRHPYQSVELNGVHWRYIDTGASPEPGAGPPRVMLAGAAAIAEVSFQSIAHFSEKGRVIAPDYPPLGTLRDLFSGLMNLLDHLGVSQFDLMGGSYGGWLAQSLVRLHPQRVHRLVLSAIGPPDSENSRQIAKMMPLFRLLPMGILRALLNRSFSRLDTSLDEYPDLALLWALVKEVLDTKVQRRDLFALFERLVDQTRHYSFNPDDLKNWPGRILMVFGSQDPASPPEKREAMQALYPQAEMVVFEGGQHGIAITHQEEYFATIDEFLMRD